MNKEDLKILLLQIREDESVRLEELHSFAHHAGLDPSQIDIVNVFDTPNFDFHISNNYHGVFIGGASEASVLEPERFPFVPHSIQFIQYLVKIKKPVFASCFGFQLAVLAQGGEIVRDRVNFEMGTYHISLTNHYKKDPLLGHLKHPFWVVSVHQEKAIELPESCELLGFTDHSTHIFKIKEAPFWAFQFHPELDKPSLTTRLRAYQGKYTSGDDHFNDIIASLVDTPESNQLVGDFVDLILCSSTL